MTAAPHCNERAFATPCESGAHTLIWDLDFASTESRMVSPPNWPEEVDHGGCACSVERLHFYSDPECGSAA